VSAVPAEVEYPLEIVNGWPPNIDQIRFWLPAVTSRNIFAHGRKIYSPSGTKLPIWLIEHEKVHFYQQDHFGGTQRWWQEFLMNAEFRLAQEIPAHQMEWRVWLAVMPRPRNERRIVLKQMAKRLSAPMYGSIISAAEAKKRITA